MNVADLIESPIPARPRPSELPAPATVDVRADDLEPGDVVAIGDRWLTVEAVARRTDGTYRIVLADGARFTASASEMWEVRRG